MGNLFNQFRRRSSICWRLNTSYMDGGAGGESANFLAAKHELCRGVGGSVESTRRKKRRRQSSSGSSLRRNIRRKGEKRKERKESTPPSAAAAFVEGGGESGGGGGRKLVWRCFDGGNERKVSSSSSAFPSSVLRRLHTQKRAKDSTKHFSSAHD